MRSLIGTEAVDEVADLARRKAAGDASARLLVLSMLFPSAAQPGAGLFIRERMFRVARHLPIVVVAPQPWFPLQGLVRLFRPHFRPMAPAFEVMDGIEVHRPRFLSIPRFFKFLDGPFFALGALGTVKRLVRRHRLNMIDAHFGYPDGYAAVKLGATLGLPVLLTLRGKESRQTRESIAPQLRKAVLGASRVVTVSGALKEIAVRLGAPEDRVTVIGNGVDSEKFVRMDREEARRQLHLPSDAEIIVSVGTLIERKGFHRVLAVMPRLLEAHPRLHYLIVGGPGPEGDVTAQLHDQVRRLGLAERVHFLGPYAPGRLSIPYSAADVFVLATGYEGWANVFLEAMACGLPVVTTRVGGNAEVVASPSLGKLVELGDEEGLAQAIASALSATWDRDAIVAYAHANSWDDRVSRLCAEYRRVLQARKVETGHPA
jgi:glycosyltransferase involved in cell wall biosynthesis